MMLGIFARTFVRPTVEEVFDAVAAHGLRCVQFNFACAGLPSLPDHVAPEVLGGIHRAAATRQISIAAVSGTFNMIHPNPNQRRDGLCRLAVAAAAAKQLDASVVTLCTGTRDPENMWRRHPDNGSPAAWRDLTVTLNEALAIAEKHNVTLAIEPEAANVVDSARNARQLLDEMRSPRLKIVMDAANLFHTGELSRMREILDEAFDLLGHDIVLVHAKELDRAGHAGNLPLGAGVLDWDHYLALLRQANFTGPLIMHGFEGQDAAASVKFLRNKLPSCGSKE